MIDLTKIETHILLDELEDREYDHLDNMSTGDILIYLVERDKYFIRNIDHKEVIKYVTTYDLVDELEDRNYDFLSEYATEELHDEIISRNFIEQDYVLKKSNLSEPEKLKRHFCNILNVGYHTDIETILNNFKTLLKQ